jgi:hypothetical protein
MGIPILSFQTGPMFSFKTFSKPGLCFKTAGAGILSILLILLKHRSQVLTKYIIIIKDIYDNVVTSVRTSDGDTNDFPINIGLHQGSTLSPYLFALVMDGVTRDIQGGIPWCMLFADDVVLVDESRTGVDQKLELWR